MPRETAAQRLTRASLAIVASSFNCISLLSSSSLVLSASSLICFSRARRCRSIWGKETWIRNTFLRAKESCYLRAWTQDCTASFSACQWGGTSLNGDDVNILWSHHTKHAAPSLPVPAPILRQSPLLWAGCCPTRCCKWLHPQTAVCCTSSQGRLQQAGSPELFLELLMASWTTSQTGLKDSLRAVSDHQILTQSQEGVWRTWLTVTFSQTQTQIYPSTLDTSLTDGEATPSLSVPRDNKPSPSSCKRSARNSNASPGGEKPSYVGQPPGILSPLPTSCAPYTASLLTKHRKVAIGLINNQAKPLQHQGYGYIINIHATPRAWSTA